MRQQRPPATWADKELRRIREEVLRCKKCDLWRTKRNYVFGEGNPEAEVMFIGEAPGYQEDLQGRPFVGAAGKLLTRLIEEVLNTRREETYIANVLKCRPPENRDPNPAEIEACSPYLDRQISAIRPRIIVTLGRYSTTYVLSKMGRKVSGITSARGKVYEGKLFGFKVAILPTYHPAAALYNPKLKGTLEEDFRTVRKMLSREGRKGENLLSFM